MSSRSNLTVLGSGCFLLILAACTSGGVSQERSVLVDDLKVQDRKMSILRDDIRAHRATLAANPTDTATKRQLDDLIAREELEQAHRLDIKASADEKARAEYESSLKAYHDEVPDKNRPH